MNTQKLALLDRSRHALSQPFSREEIYALSSSKISRLLWVSEMLGPADVGRGGAGGRHLGAAVGGGRSAGRE